MNMILPRPERYAVPLNSCALNVDGIWIFDGTYDEVMQVIRKEYWNHNGQIEVIDNDSGREMSWSPQYFDN